MPRAKKVIPIKPEVLSTKALKILQYLVNEHYKIDNCEDAQSDYEAALQELKENQTELDAAYEEVSLRQRVVNASKKEVDDALQGILKSRMHIKKLSLQVAALIDEMGKPPKKKRRKKIAKVVIPTYTESDLESRQV